MSTLIREIYYDYCRLRGEGHTNLLIDGIVTYMVRAPANQLMIRASRQQHAEDIRRRAIDKLAVIYPGIPRENWRDRIRAVGIGGRVCAFRGPIAFDNSAIMDLCEEGMRLESALAATRLRNLAACLTMAAVLEENDRGETYSALREMQRPRMSPRFARPWSP